MKKLNKKKKRRLFRLLYDDNRFLYMSFTRNYSEDLQMLKHLANTSVKQRLKDMYNEMYLLTLKLSEEEYFELLSEVATEKIKNREYYKKKWRKLEKVDNRTYIVRGTGNDNPNRIRIPSKKHKNRWKNFIRLFPQYKNL